MKRQKRRNWQMGRLDKEVESGVDAMDEEDQAALQEDIEEDPSIRQNVDIFRSKGYALINGSPPPFFHHPLGKFHSHRLL